MSWRTSSNLERVDACPASVVLTGFPYSGPDSVQGTKNHDAAEGGKLPPRLLSATAECTDVIREASFVLDVRKHLVVRVSDKPRDYGELGPWEVGTTLDFAGRINGDAWRVRDWKSRKLVTIAKKNLQILSQALAIFATRKAVTVDAGLGYLAQDEEETHLFTAFDVEDLWQRLDIVVIRGHGAKPDQIQEGEHCTYCRCLTTCPAKRQALVQLGIDMPESLDHVPAEKVGELRNVIVSVEKIIERAKALIEARARREDIPVGNGKVLRLIDCTRRSLDQAKVKDFIELAGQDVKQFEKVTPYTQIREVHVK